MFIFPLSKGGNDRWNHFKDTNIYFSISGICCNFFNQEILGLLLFLYVDVEDKLLGAYIVYFIPHFMQFVEVIADFQVELLCDKMATAYQTWCIAKVLSL